jgi:type II secretory pathway component GspD/PulD (secretin)
MKYFMLCVLLSASASVTAEIAPVVPISEGKNEFRVNTADYYTWNTRTEIYSFKHVKASEFSHLLKNCISAYGKIQINDKLNMIIITEEPNKLKDILSLCGKLDIAEMDGFEKIQSVAIPIQFSKASNILPFLRDFLSIEGDAKANDALNYISITDHPDVIARIKSVVAQFDIPPKQIQFQFHIVEVYKQNDKETGSDWGQLFNFVNGQVGYNFRSDKQTSTPQSGQEYGSQNKESGMSGSLSINPSSLAGFIKLMIEKKAIKLVADNSLLCVNNEPSAFTFHYNNKIIVVSMTPVAINDKTLLLRTKILSNGETLLENATLTDIGNSNLLLRMTLDDSQTTERKVPVLGTVFPFLFSKDVKSNNVSSIDIICTPIMQLTKK